MKQRMTIDAKNAEEEKRRTKEEDPLITTAVLAEVVPLAEAARLADLEDILLVEEHPEASKSKQN